MARVMARSYVAGFSDILEPEALAQRDVAFFETRFAESWPHMRIAVEGDAILGLSLVTNGHLDMLFVDPVSVGAGVGAALLRNAEARGCRTLECFRDNVAARAFYERQGWRLADRYEREFAGRVRAFVGYEKPPAP